MVWHVTITEFSDSRWLLWDIRCGWNTWWRPNRSSWRPVNWIGYIPNCTISIVNEQIWPTVGVLCSGFCAERPWEGVELSCRETSHKSLTVERERERGVMDIISCGWAYLFEIYVWYQRLKSIVKDDGQTSVWTLGDWSLGFVAQSWRN